MLKKTQTGVYQSTLLLSCPGLTHGYSTRELGDMRDTDRQKEFLDRLQLPQTRLVRAQQLHGHKVKAVRGRDLGQIVNGADGLVSQVDSIETPVLAVRVADCVPILAVDPNARVIGIAHAGWRGTLTNLAANLVEGMQHVGAHPSNIFISIGPHIGMCCYNVGFDRAQKFRNRFGNDPKVASVIEGSWHLDLGLANYRELTTAGIKPEHIDALPSCTSCQVTEFYSFRKDKASTFGEIMGVITLN